MNTSGIDTSGIDEFQYLKTILFSGQSGTPRKVNEAEGVNGGQ